MEEEEHNGPDFRYVIHFKQRDIDVSSHLYQVYDWKRSSEEFVVGQPYTPYLVTIQARNALGEATEVPSEYLVYSYEDSKF
jgi:hypothetical protein